MLESVKYSIDAYFKDKAFHCGGPIPPKQLFSDQNIKLVRDCCYELGFNHCYKILATKPPIIVRNDSLAWDVQVVIDILKKIKSAAIAKEYHPGLTLLHLKFCMGYTLPHNICEITKSNIEYEELVLS